MSSMLTNSNSLTLELDDFVRFMNPTQAEFNLRGNIVSRISAVVKRLWPHSEVCAWLI